MTTVTSAHTARLTKREGIAKARWRPLCQACNFQFRADQAIDVSALNSPETDQREMRVHFPSPVLRSTAI
jgi:hypothetical protein